MKQKIGCGEAIEATARIGGEFAEQMFRSIATHSLTLLSTSYHDSQEGTLVT